MQKPKRRWKGWKAMAVYIDKKAADNALTAAAAADSDKKRRTWAKAIGVLHDVPAADVVPVVRCGECRHSTLPSATTQAYTNPEKLTCHYGPCNRRNVNENDFCSYGEKK